MTKTTNYQLNQWDAEDSVKRTDFNADNAAIDAAIKTTETNAAKALAAYQAANDALVSALDERSAANTQNLQSLDQLTLRVCTGSYSGTGAAGNTITLPGTPKLVIISGPFDASTGYKIISFVTSAFCHQVFGDGASIDSNVSIVTNGFRLNGTYQNASSTTQCYIAFY